MSLARMTVPPNVAHVQLCRIVGVNELYADHITEGDIKTLEDIKHLLFFTSFVAPDALIRHWRDSLRKRLSPLDRVNLAKFIIANARHDIFGDIIREAQDVLQFAEFADLFVTRCDEGAVLEYLSNYPAAKNAFWISGAVILADADHRPGNPTLHEACKIIEEHTAVPSPA